MSDGATGAAVGSAIEREPKPALPQMAAQPPASPADAKAWAARGYGAVMRIPVTVRVVLGAARMPVSKLMSLTRGAVIPLDRKVGDLVDIVVNDRVIARGEIVVLDEEASRFAVSIRELVQPQEE